MAFAIVTAAGEGRRMGGSTPKAELELCGRPLFVYSMEAFERAPSVSGVVLTLPAERLSEWPVERLKGMGLEKAHAVVAGGSSRQESVERALREVEDRGAVVVVIHDGARPLVTEDMIEAVADLREGADGAIVAVPVTDTIKEVRSGEIVTTLPRDGLVAVQTPQAFRLGTLVLAHSRAREDEFVGTDDASLVERIGGRLTVHPGSHENIKVTYPSDLVLAEAILAGRWTP